MLNARLAQQSVTPGFLPGAGGLAWGLESPGQSSTWRILLRFNEAGTGGCGEVDRVARLIARKPSPKPEIVRRVTVSTSQPANSDLVIAEWINGSPNQGEPIAWTPGTKVELPRNGPGIGA
jgi:hypothetical protein